MAYKHSPYAMKKLTFMMLLAAFFTLCITSCSKDDDDSFAYPMEQLYGKWKAVEIKVDGKWYDIPISQRCASSPNLPMSWYWHVK